MIAVTFALPVESSDFLQLLTNPTAFSRNGVETVRGSIHGLPVVVVHTGVGERATRESLAAFFRRDSVDYLISSGLAGALDPELKIGDLLIAENYSSRELLESPHLRLEDTSIYLADVVTRPAIIESQSEREQLAEDSGAAAVDMETQFIAAACAEHNVPLLSLRAISDTITDPLPAPAKVLFNVERQKTPAARLAFYLATHPAAIRRLKSFSKRIAETRATLTTALGNLLREKLI